MSATKAGTALKSTLSPGFGRWLRGTRTGIPMKQEELAQASRLSSSTIRDLELGRREAAFSVELFVRIANGLGMDLGYVLHKAGFDLGPDGINLASLRRVEATAETFMDYEADLRSALADAIVEFDQPGAGNDQMILGLSRGLAALDRVTERLRREGYIGRRQSGEALMSDRRPWTDAERQFLIDNPNLSHEDAGVHLGRSADAVRTMRANLNGGNE